MSARTQGLRLVSFTTVLLVLGLTVATANADTIYVCWDGSGDYLTIQEGINAAQDGDEVVVCDGVYTGPGNKNIDFHGKAITVRSASGDPDLCVIDCQSDGRGFYFHSSETADAVVEGFTIRRGDAGDGGGICCWEASPTIRNCTVTGNTAEGEEVVGGGGILCEGGSPTISNCTISANMVVAEGSFAFANGGGIYCEGGSPTISNCTISANMVVPEGDLNLASGGGIYCIDGSPTIMHCTISGNTVEGEHATGGGIYCIDGSPTISNCTISDNVAGGDITHGGHGGGIAFLGDGTISNCTISDNVAGGDISGGGGIACMGVGTSATVMHCTISGNTLEGEVVCEGAGVFYLSATGMIINCVITDNYLGGGIYLDRSSSSAITNCTIAQNVGGGIACFRGSPRIINCILWNNPPEEIFAWDASPRVTYSDVLGGWPGQGNISADPRFGTEYHLRLGSPCIDAGCNGGLPRDSGDLDEDGDTWEVTPLDLDGEGRFFDDPDTDDTGCGFVPIVDMGAYEVGDTGPQPCPGDMDNDRDVDHSDLGILLSLWGATDQCDLDCDGDIDQGDLGILLAHWGEGCP